MVASLIPYFIDIQNLSKPAAKSLPPTTQYKKGISWEIPIERTKELTAKEKDESNIYIYYIFA